jgi:hypothetical protein
MTTHFVSNDLLKRCLWRAEISKPVWEHWNTHGYTIAEETPDEQAEIIQDFILGPMDDHYLDAKSEKATRGYARNFTIFTNGVVMDGCPSRVVNLEYALIAGNRYHDEGTTKYIESRIKAVKRAKEVIHEVHRLLIDDIKTIRGTIGPSDLSMWDTTGLPTGSAKILMWVNKHHTNAALIPPPKNIVEAAYFYSPAAFIVRNILTVRAVHRLTDCMGDLAKGYDPDFTIRAYQNAIKGM